MFRPEVRFGPPAFAGLVSLSRRVDILPGVFFSVRIRYMLAIAVAIPTIVTWLIANLIARSRRRIDRCPKCKSNRVRPSWPAIRDKFLFISATSPFRCEACLKRFYARKALVLRRS